MRLHRALAVAVCVALFPVSGHAVCSVASASKALRSDVLQHLLDGSDTCPRRVQDLRAALQVSGYTLSPTMVANRGYHNETSDSFSFFELVEGAGVHGPAARGDFMLGHFTERDASGRLSLAQRPEPDALLIELLAWDAAKSGYNFYELRGDGTRGIWYYRGDSADIDADVAELFIEHPARFGARLRCSGCHLNGGPILKELQAPHNDWWRRERPLLMHDVPDVEVAALLDSVRDAQVLRQAVQAGMRQLSLRRPLPGDLRVALRPLFCPHEVNLQADPSPSESDAPLTIDSAFWVDPRLAVQTLQVDRALYNDALRRLHGRFPQTDRQDADHAFLAPVKAWSDMAVVAPVLEELGLDDAFAANILAIDFTRPFYSRARCDLLATLPQTVTPNWQDAWRERLAAAAGQGNTAAAELLNSLSGSSPPGNGGRQRAARFLAACAERLARADVEAVAQTLALLASRRAEIATNDISRNPRGQILEPGFRLIFPEMDAGGPMELDPDTCALRVHPVTR